MSVRTRAGGTVLAAKAFGPNSGPQAMEQAAQDVSGMGPSLPFSPGEPVHPYDGYSRTPRSLDFQTSYNVATRPRTHERISFDTLKGLIDAYDVAQIAIWHRIDSIRSLDWKLIAREGYSGDVSDAIKLGMAALAKPDRINSFDVWLAKWLFDVLAFDAGTLYRLRNRAGRVVGLQPVDGTTIAPLLDYWGNPPQDPAEAYVQYANGLPRNWLTRADLIYSPFRPRTNSPYGHAPLEIILLNANTDIRFQLYFLQRFTEGSVPEAFASAPESWSPKQIEDWQELWDSLMYGDQSRKHQIRWMPGGSTIAWSNEKDFTDAFSLFLMRKSCAAYHVVPTDLGFTENANLASGESQADVQHRIGDLPLINFAEGIVSSFLQDDLGLPLRHAFDRGEEQEDQFQQAQADGVNMDHGVVSPSEIRQLRYGLSEPEGQIVPRYIASTRAGPVPLASLMGVAGPIDPETGAPKPGTQLPREAFIEVPGVVPNPPLTEPPLAEEEFGPSAIPPAPPMQPQGVVEATDPSKDIAKEAEGAPTTGITSDTGLYGYDLDKGDDEPEDQAVALKSELAAFHRFSKSRRRAGEWRDFTFGHADRVTAHNLNDAGRLAVRKAAGEIAVAGLAVQAADTGRVLMLQRALDPDDPAGGTWEFPGGHLEAGEQPLTAAAREWQEETGCILPLNPAAMADLAAGIGTWTSGIYQGFVYPVTSEASVPVRCGTVVSNPDDPDGDQAEAIAWWNPADLPGNPAIRPELLAVIGLVPIFSTVDPCCGCPDCCADGCCQGAGGCPCGPSDATACTSCGYGADDRSYVEQPDGSLLCWDCDDRDEVAKAASVVKAANGPKAQAPSGAEQWAGWRLTDKAVAYWGPQVTTAVTSVLTPSLLNSAAQDYLAANSQQQGNAPGKKDRNDAAFAWLAGWLDSHDATPDMKALATGILTDGYLIGAVSASAALNGTAADLSGWKPGDTDSATSRLADLGAADGLTAHLAAMAAWRADGLIEGVIAALARQLAGADGDGDKGSLGRTLAATIADAALAAGLVLAAVCASVAAAAKDWYSAHAQTETFAWVTDPTLANCPICLANEAADPRPYGEPWPSGDTAPPVHDRCGCAQIPA